MLHLNYIFEGDDGMGSVSFDVSLKVKRTDVKGYIKHIKRRSGDGVNHSNELIDDNKTMYNFSLNFAKSTIEERLEERIDRFRMKRIVYNHTTGEGTGKRARRDLNDNSVLIRGMVFAPPEEAFKDCGDDIDAKVKVMKKFTMDVCGWYKTEFNGFDTCLGGEVHMDETSPHLHLAMMPITEDGRIAQKEYFNNPSTLKGMHQRLRTHLNNNGWNVDTENKHVDAKHYNDAEYKKNANEIELSRGVKTNKYKKRLEELEEREKAVKEGLDELTLKEEAIKKREKDVADETIRQQLENERLVAEKLDFERKVELAKKKYPSLRKEDNGLGL